MLIRLPGVYRPQADTWLLVDALRQAAIPPGASVLDIGPGCGALSVAASRCGAGRVLAVDVSWPAVLATRLNTALRGLPVRVRQGDALDVAAGDRFDVIVANPPYVPSAGPGVGRARAWDAGLDGRDMLDRVTAEAPLLLAPGGMILLVHSELSGVDQTLDQLRDGGLKASVVSRRQVPFGPVLHGRTAFLSRHGLIAEGQRHEELVVIRGDRTDRAS
jgi:release factor glutamine methyltransferase